MPIRTDGARLIDEYGRTLILRGVNLGGSSKLPREPDGATHRRDGFFEHRDVSFVGRPFPLAEADEHLGRLSDWGLRCIRLLTTWEAIEHAGPGVHDEAYLDYLAELTRRAGSHGLTIFVDPHQDVWSRFSGGDGAPGWTLEAAGLDMRNFHATGAAVVHATHGDPFPQMIWPTNGWKLAAATMFTLFFGGDDFAPQTRVEGEPIQGYLQRHYLAAMRAVALRLREFPHVVGYEVMNEPMAGFIGHRDLSRSAAPLPHGELPSPFQAMLLGDGRPQRVEVWAPRLPPRRLPRRTVDPGGARAWLPGRPCVWRENGVWDEDGAGRPVLLRPQHFCHVGGRAVEFGRDYLLPFARRFAATMREAHPGALIFVEPEVMRGPPEWEGVGEGWVYAPHWYDALTLFSKRYLPGAALDAERRRLVLGAGPAARHFAASLRAAVRDGAERLGAPTLIGEVGVPFDLDGGRAFRSGDFGPSERALERSMQAIDEALASATIWNYTADNTNARGDQWNGEDLSIFSRDQQRDPSDPYDGGRGLRAAIRPHALAVAGEPLLMRFEPGRRRFTLRFRHDAAARAPTEVFVPRLHYPRPPRVSVSDGSWELDAVGQLLRYRHSPGREVHELRLEPS